MLPLVYLLWFSRLLYTALSNLHISISAAYLVYLFHFVRRNVCLKKCLTKQHCESNGLVIFASVIVTAVAGDGISPSTVQSAQLRQPLMVWSTCDMELAGNRRIYTAHVTLKESAKNSTRYSARGILGR